MNPAAPVTDADLISIRGVFDSQPPLPAKPALPRTFEAVDGRYRFVDRELGILFDLDRVRRKWSELIGELTVSCDLPGAQVIHDNVLSAADFNLSNLKIRQERANLLTNRARTEDVDWFGLLEDFCSRVLAAERAGTAVVHLRDVPRPGPDATLEIDGLTLPRLHPSILFGHGGAAKSYLALFIAGQLTLQGRRILFADWELGSEDHRDRLERLFGPTMPDVIYTRCDRPLVVEVDHLRRIVHDEHVEYMILDSVGFATDGPPEAAESAMAFFRALRTLKVGSLSLAHVSKAENADKTPFGSIFWSNSARMTWYVERAEESPDGRQVTIGLFNKKANLGPLRPAVGFSFYFDDDRTIVRRTDLVDVPALAGRLPLWQRIRAEVGREPMTIARLAAELDASEDSIKKAVSPKRSRGLFTQIPGADGAKRIALVERRTP